VTINLENIGKRFRYEWIFKGIYQAFEEGHSFAILGPNGSGKSTLMKILSGHLTPSDGNINFQNCDIKQDAESIYKYVAYAAPYIELIEEMTLTEMIDFHTNFKPLSKNLRNKDLIALLGFEKSADKEIRFFSSGMKQRLKLALSICADTPILLLDEPTTNLDAQGVEWYQHLIKEYSSKNRLTIVASNIEHDYDFCDKTMNILDYK
jgi:ABC-type multidrug transport system ATPase subunit